MRVSAKACTTREQPAPGKLSLNALRAPGGRRRVMNVGDRSRWLASIFRMQLRCSINALQVNEARGATVGRDVQKLFRAVNGRPAFGTFHQKMEGQTSLYFLALHLSRVVPACPDSPGQKKPNEINVSRLSRSVPPVFTWAGVKGCRARSEMRGHGSRGPGPG